VGTAAPARAVHAAFPSQDGHGPTFVHAFCLLTAIVRFPGRACRRKKRERKWEIPWTSSHRERRILRPCFRQLTRFSSLC
jgi:hypothetical protein